MQYRDAQLKNHSEVEKMAMPSEPMKPRHARLNLPLEVLPEAKKWEVGKTYEISLKVKQVGLNVGEHEWNNNAEFEIHGVAVHPKKAPAKKPRY